MSTTNDERREVAARLRALPSDIYSTIKRWEKDGLFIDATLCDKANYIQIHNAVFGCSPDEYVHPGDYDELHERLADLIDPTCHVVGTTSEEGLYDGLTIFRHELSCGHTCETVWLEPPAYCDECGARVVSDDG